MWWLAPNSILRKQAAHARPDSANFLFYLSWFCWLSTVPTHMICLNKIDQAMCMAVCPYRASKDATLWQILRHKRLVGLLTWVSGILSLRKGIVVKALGEVKEENGSLWYCDNQSHYFKVFMCLWKFNFHGQNYFVRNFTHGQLGKFLS